MSKNMKRRVAITGGAGFIGSNLLLHMVPKYPEYKFVNVDSLTYAGNLENLKSLEAASNYVFEKIDICNRDELRACFQKYEIDSVIHLAAETHVDRSITGPASFIETNIVGTFNLLELARAAHAAGRAFRFHHVSTDEVFGSLGATGKFSEQSRYAPNSPYSASKASADHLVQAYHTTYGLDTVVTNCSNNYGPYQFPEKLIPLMIANACDKKELPVYGDGRQVRDWLFVGDHCEALDLVFHQGEAGQTYCIGGDHEIENIELVRKLCCNLDEILGGGPRSDLIRLVTDRPGHDRRYAIDSSHIRESLGWRPTHSFEQGLRQTVGWYLDNRSWLESCRSGAYQKYYETMYTGR